MKDELSALDLYFLVKEFQTLLGSRVYNIYQPDGIYLQFRSSETGKHLLRVDPKLIWVTAVKPEMPRKLPGFCGILRKHLKGKKLVGLEQLNGERILKIRLETLEEKYFLYVELFANGNVILADKENVIIRAIEERAWKDRTIKRGEKYILPPSTGNILELEQKDFKIELKDKISTTLAKKGFGKLWAMEICARAQIDFTAKKITEDESKRLYLAYSGLLKEKTRPCVYENGHISPVVLKQFDEGKTEFKTFSEAIDSVHQAKPANLDRGESKFEKEKKRLQKLIKMQLDSANKNETDAALYQRKGELIYEHYQELKKIHDELKELSKKHSLQEIKKKLKGHKKIKDLNVKTQGFTVEVGE